MGISPVYHTKIPKQSPIIIPIKKKKILGIIIIQ